jgi:hypothetical protein
MTLDNDAEESTGTTDPDELIRQALDMADDLGENEDSYSDDAGDFDDEAADGVLGSEPSSEEGEDEDGHDVSGLAADNMGQASGAVPQVDPQEWERFQQWKAHQAQQQQASYNQQQQHYQQQLRSQQQPQQRQQDAESFEWDLPHQITPAVQLAMSLRGSEKYETLPEAQRSQADKVHDYVYGNWDRWTFNPNQLVDDLVIPRIAPVIQRVVDRMAELQAAEYTRRNPELADQGNAQRYLQIVQQASQDPYKVGLEVLRMQRALEEARSQSQGNKQRSREQQARSKSAKGKPAHKGRAKQRRGKRKRTIQKADRSNAAKIADVVMQEMLETGEISNADL